MALPVFFDPLLGVIAVEVKPVDVHHIDGVASQRTLDRVAGGGLGGNVCSLVQVVADRRDGQQHTACRRALWRDDAEGRRAMMSGRWQPPRGSSSWAV
jgi:hypothetical protein